MIKLFQESLKNKLWGFYAQRISRLKNKKITKRVYQADKLTKNIGLLYTYQQNEPEKTVAVAQISQKIKTLGASVHLLCYHPYSKYPVPPGVPAFTRQDIDYCGRSKHVAITSFWQTHFDHLYYLDFTTEPIMDYIVSKSRASYKIAPFIPGKIHLFEINFKNLAPPHAKINFEILFNKMLTYTQQLQLL